MKNYLAALMLSVCLSATAFAAKKPEEPPPPKPAEEPDWYQVRKESEQSIISRLIDPSSAQISWTQGFTWGFYKPIFQKRMYGWVGCGQVNAKNRMGGYVGATSFIIVYDGGVRYADMGSGRYDLLGPVCAQLGSPAPQAAFVDEGSTGPASTSAASVADEIAKLASLRDRGLITQAEFDQQKAKLLNR